MYTVVRKPPLASNKKGGTALRRGDSDPNVAHNLNSSAVMPSVPRTVPPRNYGHRNSSGSEAFLPQTQRGGASVYQTTNSLFSGSMAPAITDHGDFSAVSPGERKRGESRGSLVQTPTRTVPDRNASDNMAAVLGGSVFLNGGPLLSHPRAPSTGPESGVTRKAFSGPPSVRTTAGVSNDPAHRLHLPGSAGAKARPSAFGPNANQQRLVPMPQRSPNMGVKPGTGSSGNVKLGPGSPRNVRGGQQQQHQQRNQSTDEMSTTQRFNGAGALLAQTDGSEVARRAGNAATPFTLATVKPHIFSASRIGLEGTTLSRTGSVGNSRLLPGGLRSNCDEGTSKLQGADNSHSNNGGGNSNGLQYEFRVLASTGKSCTMPIKLSAGSGSLQGLRPTMEDQHFLRMNAAMVAGQHVSVIGILDGHCGRRVAELASRHVPDNFLAHSALGDNNALAFVESIIQTDRSIFHAIGKGTNTASSLSNGGSTLIAAAVHGRMLHVACLGDARAVLYDGSTTIPMSEDHKPTSRKEHSRILQSGGFVQFGRVCGVLAVSRALGDYEFKLNGNHFDASPQLMVSNVADVRQINLTDSSKFLVLACDGLWDVVENEEATQFVRDFLSYTPDVGSSPEATRRALNNCCQKLAEFAVDRGSTDNVSVVILFFHNVEDVVATFDKPLGIATRTLSNNSHGNISPRISHPGRGNFVDNANSAAFGASRRGGFNSSAAGWHGRGRSLW